MGEADGHPDEIAEKICGRIAEGEIIQALGRGRRVNRNTQNPLEAFVLSDAVLPVPVDEFLNDDTVLNPTLGELMLAEGGIAFCSPADAAKAYPQLWPNAPAAKKAFQRAGLEEGEGCAEAIRGTFPYRRFLIRECPLDPGRPAFGASPISGPSQSFIVRRLGLTQAMFPIPELGWRRASARSRSLKSSRSRRWNWMATALRALRRGGWSCARCWIFPALSAVAGLPAR
jgi:hypothetical protein